MQPPAEQDLIEARELLKKQLLVENAGWPWIAAAQRWPRPLACCNCPANDTASCVSACGTALTSSRGN